MQLIRAEKRLGESANVDEAPKGPSKDEGGMSKEALTPSPP